MLSSEIPSFAFVGMKLEVTPAKLRIRVSMILDCEGLSTILETHSKNDSKTVGSLGLAVYFAGIASHVSNRT